MKFHYDRPDILICFEVEQAAACFFSLVSWGAAWGAWKLDGWDKNRGLLFIACLLD